MGLTEVLMECGHAKSNIDQIREDLSIFKITKVKDSLFYEASPSILHADEKQGVFNASYLGGST